MSKVIVHIDLNMFFVRCEEIRDPSLIGKAVAVGHEGRSGIVSTCSYEARKYGVHSGQPMFQAKKLCPHLIIKPVDFAFYHYYSHQFFDYVKTYTNIIEKASVDECYADFTLAVKGVKDIVKFFKDFQDGLYKKTQLMCSIGVAPTKFLAKMGSDYKKPMGITIIRRRDIATILYPLSIDKFWGIGKKTEPKLRKLGINTIGDLAKRVNSDDEDIKNVFGKFYYVIKDWISGYGDDEVITEPWDPKSVGNSRTFSHDTNDYEEIKAMFLYLSQEVARRAKEDNKLGNTVQIVVKDAIREENFVSHNKSITFDNPTNDANVIFSYAMKLYDKNFVGRLIRLAGVTLQNLIDKKDMVIQMTLFDYEKHEEESQTKLLINELNRKMKTPMLKRASEVKKNDGD
ncbi:MAG: DNA polymerase IV [Bacilli bacterium]|nr:DNA polymerase IV [Bacilli bacterium]